MSTVTVCDMLSPDLPELCCFKEGTLTAAERTVLQRAAGSDMAVLGLFQDGKLIGKGGADFTVSSDAARMWMLSVDEEFRSQGLGTRLITLLELVAVERGFGSAEMLVETDNVRARSLYERLGYVVVGTATDFVYDRTDDGESKRREVQCQRMCKRLLPSDT
jgi:ribosomal protein S18 acetylase RimI-like enzyme